MTWTFNGHIAPMRPDGMPNIRAFGVDDFDVVYQPIVDCANGALVANEALVRCRHDIYANPSSLFKAASEQRSCGHLGRVIRQVAFARCDTTPLFVNVHPDELSSRWLVRPDDPMGFHAHDVYLEITETAAFTHFDLCMDVLREVCDRTGAHLVVDDFGAGHSDMKRVVDLRPAIVKLDGTLIRDIDGDRRRQGVVAEVIALFSDLGAKVVAECVETLEELRVVRDLGVHYAQGFLIARPSYPAPAPSWPMQVSGQEPPANEPRELIQSATLERGQRANDFVDDGRGNFQRIRKG